MKCSHGRHQRESFWSLGLQIAGKFISNSLWLQTHILHFVCLQWQWFFLKLWSFMGSSMRLSFIIQFKIEFLLPLTCCRKKLGKMPDLYWGHIIKRPKWKITRFTRWHTWFSSTDLNKYFTANARAEWRFEKKSWLGLTEIYRDRKCSLSFSRLRKKFFQENWRKK